MASHDLESDTGFWSTDVGAGEQATWVFEGDDGLARLSGPALFSQVGDTEFRARLTRVQVDHIALEAFGATAHRYVRGDDQIREQSTQILTFVLLAEGRVRLEAEHGAFDLEPGECVIVDSREAIRYTALSDVRMLRTMVGTEHIPAGLQRRGASPTRPLERTALIDGFVAFVSAILRASAAGRPEWSIHLVRAIADLQIAVIAEAQNAATPAPSETPLQQRIEDYIDHHLADPELGPHAIATALGISVRHAHGTFNRDDRTIGRVVRGRRLAAVATELRLAHDLPDIQDLTTRYGFASAQALQRAFRAKFGASLTEYHRQGHRQLD